MALYNFHRVLIGAAILFFFGFGLYAFRQYSHDGQGLGLAMAISSTVISAAMVGYMIYFNRVVQPVHHARGHLHESNHPKA